MQLKELLSLIFFFHKKNPICEFICLAFTFGSSSEVSLDHAHHRSSHSVHLHFSPSVLPHSHHFSVILLLLSSLLSLSPSFPNLTLHFSPSLHLAPHFSLHPFISLFPNLTPLLPFFLSFLPSSFTPLLFPSLALFPPPLLLFPSFLLPFPSLPRSLPSPPLAAERGERWVAINILFTSSPPLVYFSLSTRTCLCAVSVYATLPSNI